MSKYQTIKNIERQGQVRYVQSGQMVFMVIQTMKSKLRKAVFRILSTGQGASEGGGLGTGKHVLYKVLQQKFLVKV